MPRQCRSVVVEFLLALGITCSAQAQTPCNNPEYETQAKQNFCSEQRYRVEDRRLNAQYKKLLAALPSAQVHRLKEEQRAWLRRLEPGCKEGLGPREQGGSMWAMEFYDCMAQETAARVQALAQWPAAK